MIAQRRDPSGLAKPRLEVLVLRDPAELLRGYIKRRKGVLLQHQPEKNALCATRRLPRAVRRLVHGVKVPRINPYPNIIMYGQEG
jgi:hypothetical protein